MIKHESVNSVIAVLGLLIAIVTAYYQFVPKSDNLNIEVSTIPSNLPLIQHFDFQDGLSDKVFKISGPFFWKFTIYNNLNRTTTIKKINTKLLSGAGGLIDYSNLTVGTFDRELQPLPLPISIGANEPLVIIVGLNVPILSEESCFTQQSTLNEVQRCYFEKGYDLFGNPVHSIDGGAVKWEGLPKSPIFISRVITGDNTEFNKTLSYYPFAP